MDFWQWYQSAQAQAQAHNVPNHELEWLVLACTDLDKLALRLKHRMPDVWQHLPNLWQLRIAQRQPVQYLAGLTSWRDLDLNVTAAVLIPRPETELIIDLAVSLVNTLTEQDSIQNQSLDYACGDWADLGTGSGAIAIALARQFPQAKIHGVDLSEQALAVARSNAARHCVANIAFYQGSWFEPLDLFHRANQGSGAKTAPTAPTAPKSVTQKSLVAMIANPPYIPTAEVMTLAPEVQHHEPHLALDGGADGLRDIRHLIATAPEYLASGALWLVEHRAEQGEVIANLLRHSGVYDQITIHPDLSGWDRFVSAVYVGG